MLMLLMIAALLLDTLNAYVRLGIRRTARAGGHPQTGLPLAFSGPGRLEALFFVWLVVGLALLVYGIYSYGIMLGLGSRLIPWAAGMVLARALDSYLLDWIRSHY